MFHLHTKLMLAAVGISLFVTSCASTSSPRETMNGEIHAAISDFQNAVQRKDASAVWQMLDKSWKSQFTQAEFESFFLQNHDIFLEYAKILNEDANRSDLSQAFGFHARMKGDPCGSYQLVLNEHGEWKLSRIAEDFRSESEQKSDLLKAIKTQQFLALLDEYSRIHPELPKSSFRHIRRVLVYEDIPLDNVEFAATDAIVTVPQTARIRMKCDESGWRLVQCSLLP